MALKKEITEQIKDLLRQNPNGLSITAIVQQIPINRNTAGRYLENLMISGQVEMRHFGMAKIYSLAQRVPLSAMLSISSELIMLLDTSRRVIYANGPMLEFLSTTQKDLYGKAIEFTPCLTAFDDVFDRLKKRVQNGISGKEWSGEIDAKNGTIIFSCRIAPAVFEEGQRGVSILLENITERKITEQRIQESERQFRLLAENTLDIIDHHTPDGTCLYVSPAITSISGFEPREVIGKRASVFIHPDDLPRMERATRELTRTNPTQIMIYRWIHKEGHYLWAESLFRAIFDEKTGKMSGVYGVTRDITDRILAEQDLRESEDRYRSLVEISPDAIVLHQDGRIVYMNPAALELVGIRSLSELPSPGILDIVHPDFRWIVEECIQKDLRGEPTPSLELLLMKSDGTSVIVEGRGVRTIINGRPAVQVTMRDIAERKQAEDALRESESRYRSLAEASKDIIFLIGTDDRVEYVNSYAATMLRVPASRIIGKKRSWFFSGELGQNQAKALQRVFNTKVAQRSEGAMAIDGELHWFDHYLIPITGADGIVTSVLGVSRDISDRRKAEEALVESERRFQSLAELLPQNVWECGIDGKLTFANRHSFEMYRYAPEDLQKGLYVWQMIHTDDRERVMGDFVEALKHSPEDFPSHHEYIAVRSDGSTFPVVMYHVPIVTDGRIMGMRGIGIDITERRQMEEALRESVRAYKMLAENSVDIISRIRPDGTCIYISPAIRWSLGYEPEEVIGHHGSEFLHPDDIPLLLEKIRFFESGGADTGTDRFRMRHKDGSYVRFESTIRATRDGETGNVKEYTIVFRLIGNLDTP